MLLQPMSFRQPIFSAFFHTPARVFDFASLRTPSNPKLCSGVTLYHVDPWQELLFPAGDPRTDQPPRATLDQMGCGTGTRHPVVHLGASGFIRLTPISPTTTSCDSASKVTSLSFTPSRKRQP